MMLATTISAVEACTLDLKVILRWCYCGHEFFKTAICYSKLYELQISANRKRMAVVYKDPASALRDFKPGFWYRPSEEAVAGLPVVLPL